MTPRRVALALPVLFLALSLDRVIPRRSIPPARAVVASWDEAAPTLPGASEGRSGLAADPLNLVFVAAPGALVAGLSEAGWTRVPTTVRGSLGAALGQLLSGRAPAAFPPLGDRRLKGRVQDFNWVISERFLGERHSVRLWATGTVDRRGRHFWWGSARRELARRWPVLSRRPDPDADAERDFVLSTLARSPRAGTLVVLPHPRVPREGLDDRGFPFRTDGRVAVIELR